MPDKIYSVAFDGEKFIDISYSHNDEWYFAGNEHDIIIMLDEI